MLDDDGLPLDKVGVWTKEKHERLSRYINISRAARQKYVLAPDVTTYRGGATYIDLFCGTGRAIVRDTNEKIDGSPLLAFKCARDGKAPFTEIHIADASEDSCRAAEKRILNAGGSPFADVGTAEETAARIAKRLNPHGLHFAFLDPFNLQDLPFSVIEAFAQLKRIDMLIHVSAQDLQRNLHSYRKPNDTVLERFAPGWRKAVDLEQSVHAIRAAYLAYLASKITALGLPPARHVELVRGSSKNQRLYWLVFVGRNDFAKGLWDKIRNLSGQGNLL